MNKKFTPAVLFLSAVLAFSFFSCSSDLTEELIPSLTEFTVDFDPNGGYGTMESITAKPGQITAISNCTFVNGDKYFAGWNTARDGSGSFYNDASSIILSGKVTLYAQWADRLTLTFKPNGARNEDGTAAADDVIQEFPQGMAFKLSRNTFRRDDDNMIFAKWSVNADGSGSSYRDGETVILKESTELYAFWVTPRTITFNANGSPDADVQQQVAQGFDTPLEQNTFTREGYAFSGWNTESDGSGTSYENTDDINVSSDITLYAQWTKLWKVRIVPNGGSGADAEYTLLDGSSFTLSSAAFAKEGFGFAYWSDSPDGEGEVRYDDETELTVTEDLTFYAQWGKICTVHFNRTTEDAEGEMEDSLVPSGASFTIPPCSFMLSGHYCTGWNAFEDMSGTSYRNGEKIIVSSDMTLYASWKAGTGIMYDISIEETENGTVSSNVASAMAGDIVSLTLTPDERYKIDSLSVTDSQGNPVGCTLNADDGTYMFTMTEGSVSVEASFVLIAMDINVLQVQNGTAAVTAGGSAVTKAEPGTTVTLTLSPAEKYKFKSLSVTDEGGNSVALDAAASGSVYTFVMPQSSVTVNVQFTKITYTVTFNANITNPTGTPASITQEVDSYVTIPSNIPSKDGWFWLKWNTYMNGNGTNYNPQDSFKLTGNVTLYAQWEEGWYATPSTLSSVLTTIKNKGYNSAIILLNNTTDSDLTGTGTSSVSSVGTAIKNASALSVSLVIKNSSNLTKIGDYAFTSVTNLAAVTIPSCVTEIGTKAFYGNSNLKNMNYLGSLSQWCSMVKKSSPTEFTHKLVIGGSEITGTVTVPVNSYGYSFTGCTGITSVNLTNVTVVGYHDFEDCSNLSSVTNSGKVTEVESYGFYGCSKLSSFDFSMVDSLGSRAFSYSGLTSVYLPVIFMMNEGAFYYCQKLTSVYITGKKNMQIWDDAFGMCENLSSLTFNTTNCEIMGCRVFQSCTKLTELNLPASKLKYLGPNMFQFCTGLTKVSFGGTYTTTSGSNTYTFSQGIGAYAFADCENLTSVTIASGTDNFEKGVFSYCKKLTSITLPNSVRYISDEMFRSCEKLTTVNFPNNSNFYSIGDNAFSGCTSITSISIPDSVETIGEEAFCNMDSLTSVTLGSGIKTIKNRAFFNWSGQVCKLTSLTFNGTKKFKIKSFASTSDSDPYATNVILNLANYKTYVKGYWY